MYIIEIHNEEDNTWNPVGSGLLDSTFSTIKLNDWYKAEEIHKLYLEEGYNSRIVEET